MTTLNPTSLVIDITTEQHDLLQTLLTRDASLFDRIVQQVVLDETIRTNQQFEKESIPKFNTLSLINKKKVIDFIKGFT